MRVKFNNEYTRTRVCDKRDTNVNRVCVCVHLIKKKTLFFLVVAFRSWIFFLKLIETSEFAESIPSEC